MPLEKPQIDTLKIYFRTISSKDKTNEMLEKAKSWDPDKAHQVIALFEQRRRVQLKDLNKFFR